MIDPEELKQIIGSCFEARYLKRIQRAGTQLLLGSEIQESIVEHSFYTALRGIVFSYIDLSLDRGKLLTMCIIHDLEEVRTGDLNLVNRMYSTTDGNQAFQDMWMGSQVGEELIKLHQEREVKESPEAKASRDCDILAALLSEKEYFEKGNKEAQERMEFSLTRLSTDIGKQIGQMIEQERMTKRWEVLRNRLREQNHVPPKIYD